MSLKPEWHEEMYKPPDCSPIVWIDFYIENGHLSSLWSYRVKIHNTKALMKDHFRKLKDLLLDTQYNCDNDTLIGYLDFRDNIVTFFKVILEINDYVLVVFDKESEKEENYDD